MKLLTYITFLLISFSSYAQNRNYTYDNLGRLTQIQFANNTTLQYSYDANGNRIQHVVTNTTTNIDVSLINLTIAPTTINAGNSTTVNVVNSNIGSSACGGQNVIAYLSTDNVLSANDVLLNTYYVSSISASSNVAISNWSVTIPNATTAGTYYIILKTDANNIITETDETNNTIFNAVTITTCPTIAITETVTSATCGINNGIINFIASNGVAPYQYSINNGTSFQSVNNFTNLSASNYTCIIKDANGCSNSKTVVVSLIGGNAVIPSFTNSTNGQIATFANTSQNATTYSWDFGDGNTSTSANPTHTFAGSGVYNVCLTATNSCGSNVYCGSVNIINNYMPPSTFPKMFYNNAKEVNIKQIAKSINNDGWIIVAEMSQDNGTYSHSFIKVYKIDSLGNTIWNKDLFNNSFPFNVNAFKLVITGNGYALHCNTDTRRVIFFDDNGIGTTNLVFPSYDVWDIASIGSYFYTVQQVGNYSFKVKQYNINNLNVILNQSEYNLGSLNTISDVKLLATSDSGVVVAGTVADLSFIGNPRYIFIQKINGNQYGLSYKYNVINGIYQYASLSNIIEDKNHNIIISSFDNHLGSPVKYSFKIDKTNGNVINSGYITENAIAFDNSNNYYFNSNEGLIKTDSNFQIIQTRNYNTNYYFKSIVPDVSRKNIFILTSKLVTLNQYLDGMNVIAKLDSNIKLSNSCMNDTLKINQPLTPITIQQYYLNPTSFLNSDIALMGTYSLNNGVILDSNECYVPPCNVSASFSKSKNTACIGDVINFTSTSANAYAFLWRINGVNSGTSSSIQKTFSTAGTYIIQLIASNSSTCYDTTEFVYTIASTIVVSSIITNNNCGLNNGSILMSNSGGTSPFLYSIDNGSNFSLNNSFNNLASSNYTIKVVDVNGCSATNTATINTTANPNLSISAIGNIPTCSTTCNGTIIASASGGVSPYTFSINPISTQNTVGNFSNLCANTIYTITTTDGAGCTKTSTLSITNNSTFPTPSITSLPVNATICAGASIALTATGGATYSWSGGITNGTAFTPTATTIYTVTATSASGCTATATKTVTVNSLPTISISTLPNDTICASIALTLSATGGTTYSWTGGITNGTSFTPTASGTYTVTVTNSNGCTKTQTQSIVVNSLPIVNISATPNDTICAGTSVTLTAIGGTTYSWSGGITNGTAFTPTATTIYTVTATSASGCTATATKTVTVNSLPTISISTLPNDTICAGIALTLSSTGGTTYSWTGGITNGTSFTPTASGTYTVTVTNSNGCTKTLTQSIVVNPLPIVNISATPNDTICTGTALTLSATGGTTYSWSGGITNGNSFTPTTSGTYTVTVTNSNGCTKTQTQSIVVNSLPIVNISATPNDTICAGTSVTLTATGGTTHSWSGGISNGTSFTPTTSGTYTVTVSNSNGCTKTQMQSIVVNSLPIVNISATPNDTICAGTSVTLTATGVATYSWSGGITNGTAFIPTATTIYTVTATSASGCNATATKTVTVNPLPTISISATPNDTICAGTSVTLTATGGTTYSWSGGISNGTSFTPTTSGTYTVTVTNSNGCTKTQTQSIVVNPLPTINISSLPNDTICSGTSVTLTAIGGTSYTWTGGITNGTAFTPTASGIYTLTATNVNGCTITQTQSIVVNPLPIISISTLPNDSICTGASITLTASGGGTYSWSGGINNGVTFTPSSSGIYTVTVIDNNNCSQTWTQHIIVNPLPIVVANIIPNDTICSGIMTTMYGSGANLYSWNLGILDSVQFTPSISANYILIGTDSNGCINSDTINLVVNTTTNPIISILSNPIQGTTGDAIVYTATTNVPLPYSIDWYRNSTLSYTGVNNIWNDFIIAGNNSIYAIIKNASTCLSPDSAISNQLEILNVTGLSNISPEGFSIFPNPTNYQLTVKGLKVNDELRIYNMLGQLIKEEKNNSLNNKIIDISSFSSGIYTILFSRENKKWVSKFEKK